MFPDFHYLFQSLFGINIEALSIVKTFGFFVALAFLGGAWALTSELKRKKEEGIFQPETITQIVGKPASSKELAGLFILGFIIGGKLVGLILQARAGGAFDPVSYLFSFSGNLISGLILGGILAYFRYSEKKKTQKAKPVAQKIAVYPHQRVADILFIAAIAGFAGAKLFNAFETWDDFLRDPIGNLFSPSGLTYYGGLICATAALYGYSRKKKFSFRQLCDAAAPALMLAYGLGRLGCQMAGDGDWGIYNSAYTTQITAEAPLVKGTQQDYDKAVKLHPESFHEFPEFNQSGNSYYIPHKYFAAPDWLPVWLVAQNYKHNVNNAGVLIPGDQGEYNHVLPVAVFPTPLYEIIVCLLLFLFLWKIRKRFKYPLQLFGIYLILNGIERFFVETIRVNYKYDMGLIHPTQAEIISTCLVIAGIVLFFVVKQKGRDKQLQASSEQNNPQ